ncbi:MAG TPA: DNA-binding transcriptional regulator AraC, partial [Enterobacter sp.]|nr:DNA-binding transcriptional regulator AraC [Enterobacter sp.]
MVSFRTARRTENMAETQSDPLLSGYSFNAHLVAGLTPIEADG